MASTTDTIIIEPAAYAVLPTGGSFEFEADAEFFRTYGEAMDEALDWSVEESLPVRVYAKREGEWVPVRDVEA